MWGNWFRKPFYSELFVEWSSSLGHLERKGKLKMKQIKGHKELLLFQFPQFCLPYFWIWIFHFSHARHAEYIISFPNSFEARLLCSTQTWNAWDLGDWVTASWFDQQIEYHILNLNIKLKVIINEVNVLKKNHIESARVARISINLQWSPLRIIWIRGRFHKPWFC